jgi:Alpha/beta hydrolase domain
MTVQAAALNRPQSGEGSAPYVPPGEYRGRLDDFDYIEEEWFATGEADGRPYTTAVFVRRPRDRHRFSGTVVVEPLHAMGAPPIWLYTSDYIMRSGHGWAVISSQKTALDAHVKSSNPQRYESLAIESDPPPPDAPEVDSLNLPVGDPAKMAAFFAEMQRQNQASNTILAQVGAAIAASAGPFEGWDVAHVILTGHSQTGGVVTDYIRNAHESQRFGDGSPVYHGYFPSGAPGEPFGACDVPIVQLVSEGDIADPNRPGREGRKYRRDDSDEPGDRYRLYELAGVPHMGTRYPPYNNPEQWQQVATAGTVPTDVVMNSLPHGELFNMALHHLVQWVAEGVAPPRAERIEVGPDGYFAQDEYGNSRGGLRCVEMDVPRARYFANPKNEDGTPAFGVVGTEEPLEHEKLEQLYKDHVDYVERFNRRLDELIGQGWLLAEDAEDLRNEAEKAEVP